MLNIRFHTLLPSSFSLCTIGIISIGFYYSTHPRKIKLLSIWRANITREAKIASSLQVWAEKMSISPLNQTELVNYIVKFLLYCWSEEDAKIALNKLSRKSKKEKQSKEDIVPKSSKVTSLKNDSDDVHVFEKANKISKKGATNAVIGKKKGSSKVKQENNIDETGAVGDESAGNEKGKKRKVVQTPSSPSGINKESSNTVSKSENTNPKFSIANVGV